MLSNPPRDPQLAEGQEPVLNWSRLAPESVLLTTKTGGSLTQHLCPHSWCRTPRPQARCKLPGTWTVMPTAQSWGENGVVS